MRTEFVASLVEAARADPSIWLVTGDLGYGVLEPFATEFPERYVNVGVAEQTLAGVAAGIARAGGRVFAYSIATFAAYRCWEQWRNDVAEPGLPVIVVGVGGGFAYGVHGYSHHALEDLALMRALPNFAIVAPGDGPEARALTFDLARRPGPAYLRLGHTTGKPLGAHREPARVGEPRQACLGATVSILATGGALAPAFEAAGLLDERGTDAGVVSVHTLRPLPGTLVGRIVRDCDLVVSVEDHRRTGGLASALFEAGFAPRAPWIHLAAGERVDAVGSAPYLHAEHGIDAVSIAEAVVTGLRRRAA